MRGILFLVSVLVGTMIALQPVVAQEKAPPASLVDVGEFAENIYDFAKDKDWAKVGGKLTDLQDAVKKLTAELPGGKALDPIVAELKKAIAAKDPHATLLESNKATLAAANLIEPFNPKVPANVTRLDYYGREMEIWSMAKNIDKCKAAGEAIAKTWAKVKPAAVKLGGTAEAKRFDELVTKVAAAQAVNDYAQLFAPILEEVDNLEKVFKK